MPKIKLLPPEIRGKIAAGEVIERPASVIKELLENAFDAGATRVKVEFTKGGLERIAVYDNGEGMSPEDLKVCYLPFATSKLTSFEDLLNLSSYGFRGEALHSIAQVSNLRIISKSKDEPSAFEIEISFGSERAFRPAKLKEGTLVIVENLFKNLPARLAFLKNTKTETTKNLELIRAIMLTNPHIRFEVIVDEKKHLYWKGGSLPELLSYIFEIDQALLQESEFFQPPLRIHLVLSSTQKTFPHSRFLFILVNKRLIKDEKLSKVFLGLLKHYYGPLGYPLGVLHIQLPPHLVDFNVHPAKWEVRFKKESDVTRGIESAIKDLFSRKKVLYKGEERPELPLKVEEDLPLDYSPASKTFFDANILQRTMQTPIFQDDYKGRLLGVFQEIYALYEKDKELYIIDLHALTERIIYEELREKRDRFEPQVLLIPMVIKLSSEMLADLEEKLQFLKEYGFEVESFGPDGLIVRAVPADLRDYAREIIEEFLVHPWVSPDKARDNFKRDLACKLAKRRGDYFSQEERLALIKRFFRESLETCPHGRPIFFKLSLEEIEKRLKRKP